MTWENFYYIIVGLSTLLVNILLSLFLGLVIALIIKFFKLIKKLGRGPERISRIIKIVGELATTIKKIFS